MSHPDPIRWGICGTGNIATSFAEALGNVDDAELVAVASLDADRLGSFAGRFQVPTAHLGYEELADDGDVDIVYVASTQQRHLRDVLLFLEGGRHVLCEKPFALSRAQAQIMIDTAKASDLFVMEAMWARFLPSYVRLVEVLAGGAIGTPQLLEANFSFRVPDDEMAGHRLFDPHRGGGALLDLGIYPVHLAQLVLGAPTSIHAEAVIGESGVDEQTALLLRHDAGAMSLLHMAIRTRGSCAARLVGTDGVLHIDPLMHAPNRLRIERGPDTETLDFADASLHFQVPEVHRCLRAGLIESELMPHADTLAMLATLDEARRQIGLRFPGE